MALEYRKSRAHAPKGFFECEGKGLEWLGEATAQGGPRVVKVYGWGDDHLDIERVQACSPTPQAARRFGAALAHMHDTGAAYFGSAPDGYDGTCYFGPLQDPVPMDTGAWTDPATYLAEGRLRPMVQLGIERGTLRDMDMDLTNEVIDALPELLGRAGADRPARVHGDLWSGNVMWTADRGDVEAVLIDPAAHGGHRETDLAMLALFGCPHLGRVVDGYESAHPLRAGWEQRVPVHQLHPLAVHAAGYGAGYGRELHRAALATLELGGST